MLQSAREALGNDTAAADLNLIYAAARSWTRILLCANRKRRWSPVPVSPAQRMLRQFNYVAGGGRLTPQARKNLAWPGGESCAVTNRGLGGAQGV